MQNLGGKQSVENSQFSKKTGRSAYSALSSGFDYVAKYFVYGN